MSSPCLCWCGGNADWGAQVQAARMKEGETTGEVGLVPENYLTLVERIELEDQVDPNEEAVDWGSEQALEAEEEDVQGKDECSTPKPVEEE